MIKETYNVLIVDDHPAIIDGFKNALSLIAKDSNTIDFNVDSANDCKSAYYKRLYSI